MNLTPQRKKELLIAAGGGGGLLALIYIRKKSGAAATSTGTVGSTFDPSSLLSSGGGFDPLGTGGGGSPDTSGSFTFLTPTDPTTVLPGGDASGAAATVTATDTQPSDSVTPTPVYVPPPAPSPLTVAGGLDPAIATRVAAGPAPVAAPTNDTGGAARTAPKSTVAKSTPAPAKKQVSGYNRKTVAAIH